MSEIIPLPVSINFLSIISLFGLFNKATNFSIIALKIVSFCYYNLSYSYENSSFSTNLGLGGNSGCAESSLSMWSF